ncbi:NAD(P)H-dependent glycerol-3-phosphate dehydrogenase [bacterium]|nr:NAD(P)H-dependent glycerol-3-phosphate dehydrogenase [bacterium]
MMKIGIFGSGSWGTALSMILHSKGYSIHLWSNDQAEADKIKKTRRLLHKLADVQIPESIQVTANARDFIEEADLLVVAIPSKFIRSFAESMAPHLSGKRKIVVSATKGIEASSLKTMSEILEETWLHANSTVEGIIALSGPSHAEEVATGMPTAVVAAHAKITLAEEVQDIFSTSRFRVYANDDPKGVEIGAAMKNVLAIAVGISDGLGYGDNARAALISRGLYELSLAGCHMGAKQETFSGLSGLGDLVVTCTSRHSRNRRFGELIAKGYKMEEAEEEIGMVVEGITTVKAVPDIKKRYNIELPISEEVHAILFNGTDPLEAVQHLMMRETKTEKMNTP